MRAVIQRVKSASVSVDGTVIGTIGPGILVFLGIKANDSDHEIEWMAEKILNLRIFPDGDGKMNRSLYDIDGEMLIISQFTLYGDCRKGRRPGYSHAAPPETALPIYNQFVEQVRRKKVKTATGTFQAAMDVSLVNDGPVTLLIDTEKQF
ncbi:MAG: D-tyrosyl-tRNA(Tyr) deacylase [Desulfobacterales bacterium]|nr:MAG: D-tyrosyl-tRNA(Tyr) deacylase [Desulfobacterales bacterium]